jgi:hypothetical protein
MHVRELSLIESNFPIVPDLRELLIILSFVRTYPTADIDAQLDGRVTNGGWGIANAP